MNFLAAIREYIGRIRAEVEAAHRSAPGPKKGVFNSPGDKPWIGVDLDGTLAFYEPGSSLDTIGPPIAPMLKRLRHLLADGWRIKIVTARAADPEQLVLIQQWLRQHDLPPLEITNAKDFSMIRLYDDRAVQVESNTGRIISENSPQEKDVSET